MIRYTNLTRFTGPGGLTTRGLGQWMNRSLIKSPIQRGTISITAAVSNTATITAVVPGNSRLRLTGVTNDNAGQTAKQALVQIEFTDATTITARVNSSPGATTTAITFEVTEYWPGVFKSLQRNQTTAAAGTATLPIAVNPDKTELDYLGCTDSEASTIFTRAAKLFLTNSTTITISYGGANAQTVSWQACEYY